MHKDLNVAGILILFFTGETEEFVHRLPLSHGRGETVFTTFNESQIPLK